MDFHSLNRRDLQSLCKLNRIPANITNIAMADALKSLETVVGVEEIEISSPRLSCTSYKTSTWKKVKKSETESLFSTASRASREVRRQLTGEANDFLKTPLVSGVRKKGTATLTRENTVKREDTVQRVYNTRRSARLTEKKCTEPGVTERDISQPVKIASFSEEVIVTSEEIVGSGSSSVETSHESNMSSESTEHNVEKCDEGISMAKVEDICIEFEKLDVVIADGSDLNLTIEKVICCEENVDLEEKQKVEAEVILNELKAFAEKRDHVDNIKPDSTGISNPCEDGYLEQHMMAVYEKIDPHEAMNVSIKEHLAPGEPYDILLCDKVLSGENVEKVDCCGEDDDLEEKHKVEGKFISKELETSEEKKGQIDTIKPDSKGISNPCEDGDSEDNVMVVDGKTDPHEALNFLVEEHVASEEHFDSLLYDRVLSGKNNEKEVCCGENVDLGETHKVDDKFILNELETSEKKRNQVDNIKPDLEGISNPCENEDSEAKLMMVYEKIEPREALNVLVKEHHVNLALEEHTDSLLCDKVLTEADDSNVDSVSCDIKSLSDPSVSVSEMKNGINPYEASNVSSVKEHSVYLALEERSDSLLSDKVLSGSVLEKKNEVLECIGSSNNKENPSELSKLDNLDNHNVALEMTTEPEGIEESISANQVDETHVNPNEQEPSKDFETPEESQNSLIKETVVDLYQETEKTITRAADVINNPTHLTSISKMIQVSDNSENIVRKVQEVIVEDDNKKPEDKKPPQSLNDTSMRQLKKKLKALSIKSNINTNKDDQVAEVRPVLQAVCYNHLATSEER